jgi:hypothetical protein
MNASDIKRYADRISELCIHHANFDQSVVDIQAQLLVLQRGEVLVIVGPSRVGKSRACRRAIEEMLGSGGCRDHARPFIWIDNENSQASGEFSTRAFMLEACRQIEHPIYGSQHLLSDEGLARLERHLARVPEATFRGAFELGLKVLGTRYLIVDEAHHVMYAKGGDQVAAKILDSWKCLAWKTGVVLVLIGSYALATLMERAPHLIGRNRRPLELPRYKEFQEDIAAFGAVLATYSANLPFANPKTSLMTWNRQLFHGSLGCVGHLSLWIRSAIAWMASHKEASLTWRAFEATAFLKGQYAALLKEIVEGEGKMGSVAFPSEQKTATATVGPDGAAGSQQDAGRKRKALPGQKPFAKRTCRRARGERG